MDKADKIAWKFLVENGDVVKGWSYYGSMYEVMPVKTKNCSKLIKEVGVDWDKTRPVRDDTETGFAGTFADHGDEVKTMSGTLILKDGSEWKWGATNVDARDIFRFVCELVVPDEVLF
jgi:hypothetical protein